MMLLTKKAKYYVYTVFFPLKAVLENAFSNTISQNKLYGFKRLGFFYHGHLSVSILKS